MEKNKILISTFNNSKNNYGAVFQAHGLSVFVKKMGYDPCFLSVEDRGNAHSKRKTSLKMKIKTLASKLLSLSAKKAKEERTKKFVEFYKWSQNQLCYDTTQDVLKSPPEADCYLSGSDQVWNPIAMKQELFMTFAPQDKPLVSYAASMGNEKVPQENKELFAEWINRYDRISVREDTMKEVLEEYTDKPIVQNIDPVFLLEKEEWQNLAKPYKKLKYDKYILAYIIDWDKNNNQKLINLKKQTGLPIVLVSLGGLKTNYANQMVIDASPQEFLYLLNNAEMVVASSFHGVALSIVHNKPFIAVPDKTKGNRIKSMLRHFNLESHDTLDFSMQNAVADYQEVNDIIEKDRIKAKEYLTECFNIKK